MTGKGAKNKGSTFERKIAVYLGKWYYNDPMALGRTRNSGARAHSSNVEPGDIGLVKDEYEFFPIAVECKHRKDFLLDTILQGKCLLLDAWQQLIEELNKCLTSKLPIVIAKTNRRPNLCMVDEKLFSLLHIADMSSRNFLCVEKDSCTYYVMLLDDLLKLDTKDLKNYASLVTAKREE